MKKTLFHFVVKGPLENAQLSTELDTDMLAGPFATPPFPLFRIWPLGLVPKKIEGVFRLIQHLFYTKDFSFTKENNGISFDDTSVSHATVKDATGKVCMLVKIVFDVKSAFCLIPIRPEDNDQSGIYWKDLYY